MVTMGPISDRIVCKMGATSDRLRDVCNNMGPISDIEKCVKWVQQVTDLEMCVTQGLKSDIVSEAGKMGLTSDNA